MQKARIAALVAAASFYFMGTAFAGGYRHSAHRIEHKTVQVTTQTVAQPVSAQVYAPPVLAVPVAASVVQPYPVYAAPLMAPMVQPVVQVVQPVATAVSLPSVVLEQPAAITVHGLFSMPPTVYMGARVAVPVEVRGAVVVPAPSW